MAQLVSFTILVLHQSNVSLLNGKLNSQLESDFSHLNQKKIFLKLTLTHQIRAWSKVLSASYLPMTSVGVECVQHLSESTQHLILWDVKCLLNTSDGKVDYRYKICGLWRAQNYPPQLESKSRTHDLPGPSIMHPVGQRVFDGGMQKEEEEDQFYLCPVWMFHVVH